MDQSGERFVFPRRSPVLLPGEPAETETRGGWTVTRRFSGEGVGPWLMDLSHRAKWDIQDAGLDRISAIDDVPMPSEPGGCACRDGRVLLRPSVDRAVLWRLNGPEGRIPYQKAFTDVTDAWALLALGGREVPFILEKATPMDAMPPGATAPYLCQGPVFERPAYLVVLVRRPETTLALVACPRGYGRYVAEAFMEAGEEYGMLPAGEDRFLGLIAPPDPEENAENG